VARGESVSYIEADAPAQTPIPREVWGQKVTDNPQPGVSTSLRAGQ